MELPDVGTQHCPAHDPATRPSPDESSFSDQVYSCGFLKRCTLSSQIHQSEPYSLNSESKAVGDNPEGHLQLGIQNQRRDRQRFRDHHGSPARDRWPVLPEARFVPKSDSQIDWSRHDDRDGLPDGSFQEIITVCPDTR